MEFDWDEKNIAHLARHSITPQEAVEVFRRDPIYRASALVDGEERYRAYGMTRAARLLVIAFTIRTEKIRPITGWDFTKQERKRYAKEIYERQFPQDLEEGEGDAEV